MFRFYVLEIWLSLYTTSWKANDGFYSPAEALDFVAPPKIWFNCKRCSQSPCSSCPRCLAVGARLGAEVIVPGASQQALVASAAAVTDTLAPRAQALQMVSFELGAEGAGGATSAAEGLRANRPVEVGATAGVAAVPDESLVAKKMFFNWKTSCRL